MIRAGIVKEIRQIVHDVYDLCQDGSVDDSGNVYVTDRFNNRIQKFK